MSRQNIDVASSAMRIGVIGGTFDPIHIGHLIIAEEARTRLDLSRVVFVPAGQPPHKTVQQISDPERRLEMVQLAVSDHEHFCVSRLDIDREGPCYTVDTIRLLRNVWGADAEIYFLIGADSLADLPKWHQPDRLLRMCHVVAVQRPGYKVDLAKIDRLIPGAAVLIQMLAAPTLDISSTEIRNRVGAARSIRYLVPASVERYIDQHGLYRALPGQ
jgi:nicotinate-nucleotide adenylyltransferase